MSYIPKNKSASIRINSEVLTEIKKLGLSPQKIIDEWVMKNILKKKACEVKR